MPSSSLVEDEDEFEVGVEVGVEVEVEVGVGVEVWVDVGGVRVGVGLTCSHDHYFHGWVVGWVGGVENSRIELTSAKLG